jgi:aliphatic nitrilase
MDVPERSPRSVSMILDPSGSVMGQPLATEEGIVYAHFDTPLSVEPKQFHDVVRHLRSSSGSLSRTRDL